MYQLLKLAQRVIVLEAMLPLQYESSVLSGAFSYTVLLPMFFFFLLLL